MEIQESEGFKIPKRPKPESVRQPSPPIEVDEILESQGEVENFRQKIYLDDKWRKVTKSEHIIKNPSGDRVKVLTSKVQSPDGTCKIRQKITKL